jgi:hypothetical protein
MESLTVNGEMTLEDLLVDKVFSLAGGNRRGIREAIKRLLAKNLITRTGNQYSIVEEAKGYVEDVMEIYEKMKPENVVQSPYRNIWTPEMNGYTKSLYANKRGY